MARSRNIKPGFFKNEDLADLTTDVRLLFVGLWCLADREGRIEDRPRRIKAELFPFDNFEVDPMLNQLQNKGFIVRYEASGENYLSIVNFVKHQDPHYKEKASEIPPPEGQTDQIKATGVTRSQRERILVRDKYSCQHCGSKQQLCIDHILPVSRGGDSSDENLQVLCLSCNTSKGNKINGETKNTKPNRSGFKQEFGPNSIQGRINSGSKQEHHDTLIPDSLNLIPDSLIPEEKTCSIPDGNEKSPSCPHDEIISLYHAILPELPSVRVWGKDNKANLRARWREDKERQSLPWWDALFREIKTCPFLVGGKTDFMATLGWIVGPKNFTKILNGAYRDHRAPPPRQERLTPRQQQMRDIADMRNAIEERENGIDLERCSSIAGETLLALPGGGA